MLSMIHGKCMANAGLTKVIHACQGSRYSYSYDVMKPELPGQDQNSKRRERGMRGMWQG